MNERSTGRGRKRSRSRNRRGGASGGKSQTQSTAGSSRKQAPKVDPTEFWGDSTHLPDRIEDLRHSPDVRAVLTSLGRPPLTGNETAAEHWFSMVYERAAFLAGALAAAGGLDADGDDDHTVS